MTLPSLSIVLPTFNEAMWLPATIAAIDTELLGADWTNTEIVVVNDGSSDHTANVLQSLVTHSRLRVLVQENAGRFAARKAGIESCSSEFILLIDSRVHPVPGSFKFLKDQFAMHPERRVWNGDVDLDQPTRPYAAFWLCITRLAWRRYFRTRSLTSFGAEDFDYYPKGTTFFLAPRVILREVISRFDTNFDDLKLANDDTLLIKPIADSERIFLSPEFRCTYFSRDSAKKFLKHSFHRGTVFVDAYLRRGSRYLGMFIAAALTALFLSCIAFVFPLYAAALLVVLLMLLAVAFARAGCEFLVIIGFFRALPLFVPSYGAGVLRGLWLLKSSSRRQDTK
jgi:glycosyltransferase involved in cell wall biosynthesis